MNDIGMALSFTAAFFCAMLYLAYRHLRHTLHELERHGISGGGGAVPTMVMEQDAPVEIVLPGERRLYISTLTMQQADKWRKEFVLFLGRHILSLNLMPFLEMDNLKDKEDKILAILKLTRAIQQYKMKKALVKLLHKTLLRDRRRNPGNVTARWLWQNCTELELAEILLVTYAYNNGAFIKKNYLLLLEKVGGISPGMSDMQSSNLPRTDAEQIGIDKPLFSESPFAQGLGPNALAKKSGNLNA
jgi:hypothetical protein